MSKTPTKGTSNMDLTDFSKGQSWAIIPEYFETVARRFHQSFSDMQGGKLSKEIAEKLSAFKRKSEGDALYSLSDSGIATLPVIGPLTKRTSFWSFLFGASSYEDIRNAFDAAIADDAVRGVVLDIDSPGGVVNGVDALSEAIYNARDEKPVVAFANGLMASAAYWIGSAAEAVIGSKTSEVGSIGVIMVHRDFSRYEDNLGVKTTYITAGKYKALGNDAEPLSYEARQTFEAELNKIYTVFVDTVARNRDASSETVREDMADGRIFIGQDAAAAGLIDDVGTIEDAVAMAASMIDDNGSKSVFFIPRGSIVTEAEKTIITMEESEMPNKNELKISDLTVDMLRAENPDLIKSIETAARADAEKGMKETVDNAVAMAKETGDRMIGLANLYFGADETDKFEKLVNSGVTVEQYEAIAAINPKADKSAEGGKRDEMLAAIQKAGDMEVGTGGDIKVSKDFQTMIAEYRAQTGCSYQNALLAVRKANPKAHEDWIKSVN